MEFDAVSEVTVAKVKDAAKKNWVQVAWLLKLKATLEWGSFENHAGCNATRKRGEKATAVRPSRNCDWQWSRHRQWVLLVNAADAKFDGWRVISKWAAKQANSPRESIESNWTQSVSGQSGGAQRRHHLVNIDLKPVVYRQVRCHTEAS
jgi:hypothetical protein